MMRAMALCGVIALGMAPLAMAAGESNALPNGGFEGSEAGWRAYQPDSAGVAYAIRKGEGRTGDAAHIRIGDEATPGFYRWEARIAVPAQASSFRFGAWFRAGAVADGRGVSLGLAFSGADGQDLKNFGSKPAAGGDGQWREAVIESAIPAGAAFATARLLLHGRGEVWWDDARLDFIREGKREIDLDDFLRSLAPPAPRAAAGPTRVALDGSRSLGRLAPFWRTIVRPDMNLDDAARRAGTLARPPDWLAGHPLYAGRDRSQPTLLFGDTLSAVRLLGGWPKEPHGAHDLAVREGGEIRYRWPMLHGRLESWVASGLDVLVVLDNVPFCFVAQPSLNTYGQVMGPDMERMAEYRAFIRALVEELVRAYGRERVAGWRFRIGTEPDLPGHWQDTAEKFCAMYEHAAAGVRDVLPEAPIGPGNFITPRDTRAGLADEIMTRLARGRNSATGGQGAPVDFIAGSVYATPRLNAPRGRMFAEASPEKMRLIAWKLKRLRTIDPRFASLPLELHEFGPLNTDLARNAEEHEGGWAGAHGAAWTHQAYAVALEEGFRDIFYWFNTDRMEQDSEELLLLRGYGWLRGMLERLDGGVWQLARIESAAAAGVDVRAIAAARGDALWISLSSFCLARTEGREAVRVTVPRALFDVGDRPAAQEYRLSRATCAYDAIHADLRARGLLRFDNGEVYEIRRGLTPEGRARVWEDRAKYEAMQAQSFAPAPLRGMATVQGGDLVVETTIETPGVLFIEIRPAKAGGGN